MEANSNTEKESLIDGLSAEESEMLLDTATLSAFLMAKDIKESEDMYDSIQFLYKTLIVYFMQGFRKDFNALASLKQSAQSAIQERV